MISTLGLGAGLLAAALAPMYCHAQGSISSTVSTPLTDNPDSEPTTTLAIDLLAPQRPYTFDPTGASVSANALDPSVYVNSLAVFRAQTDTQLRDSSQTGRTSPYAQGNQRLGLNASGDNPGENQNLSDGSFRSAVSGGAAGRQDAAGGNYQSSWGSSSSFGLAAGGRSGAQPDGSSWGHNRLYAARSVAKQADSMRTPPGVNGELANEVSGGGAGGTVDSLYPYGQTSRGSSRSGGTYRGSRMSPGGRPAGSSSKEGGPRTINGNEAAAGNLASNGMGGGTAGGSGNGKSTAAAGLAFFPAADADPFTLGRSPFSSPGGEGELHFLTPNILAATSRGVGASMTGSGNSDATRSSLRQAFVHRKTLETSAGNYGLTSHLSAAHSLAQSTSQSTGTRKRSHLPASVLDSGNP